MGMVADRGGLPGWGLGVMGSGCGRGRRGGKRETASEEVFVFVESYEQRVFISQSLVGTCHELLRAMHYYELASNAHACTCSTRRRPVSR